MDTLKNLIKAIDDLPVIAKYILCIPLLDLVWAVYRLARSIVAGNTVNIVINVVILIIGIPFFWLVDLIFLLWKGQVLSLD